MHTNVVYQALCGPTSRTWGVAVAVRATMGTEGNSVRSRESCEYSGRKSWPQSLMQWASSMTNRASKPWAQKQANRTAQPSSIKGRSTPLPSQLTGCTVAYSLDRRLSLGKGSSSISDTLGFPSAFSKHTSCAFMHVETYAHGALSTWSPRR